jgi:hypothetical protein
VNKRRTTSALSSGNYKLFRELLHFIEKCKRLHTVSFESVDISVDALPHLGKALATSASGNYMNYQQFQHQFIGFNTQKFVGWVSIRVISERTKVCTF